MIRVKMEAAGIEPASKLCSILKITYTIANLCGWRAGNDQVVRLLHHLFLLAVNKRSA